MSCNNKKPKRCLPILPNHLIRDRILTRAPVKSVGRFKCVSKFWRDELSNKDFVKAHLQSMRSEGIVIGYPSQPPSFCTLNLAKEDRSIVSEWFLEYIWDRNTTILGTCHGLVLGLHTYDTSRKVDLSLSNPITLQNLSIPYISHTSMFGIGYDKTAECYKILGVTYRSYNLPVYKLSIYATKDKAWRRLGKSPYQNFMHVPSLFLNGAIHFLAAAKNSFCYRLVAFNLEREKFTELPYHKDFNPPRMFVVGEVVGLAKIRGCMAIMKWQDIDTRDVLEVWVMKEYDVQASWQRYEIYVEFGLRSRYIGVVEEDNIVFKTVGGTLVGYKLESGLAENLIWDNDEYGIRNLCFPEISLSFTESLVSPVPQV